MIKCLMILLANLPRIISIIEEIERAQTHHALEKKVMDDKRAIEEAFRNRDSHALGLVFRT